MSECQVGIVVVLYVTIVLAITAFISQHRISKKLRTIENLLLVLARQNTNNKSDVSDTEGNNE